MNNSLDRLLEGIAIALRRDVIPRLDDDYASGQALAVIDLVNNLKLRVDWAVPPLLARANAQRALTIELEQLLVDHPGRPRPDGSLLGAMPVDGTGLQALCDRLDAFIGELVRWLSPWPETATTGAPAQGSIHEARARISRHVSAQLRRDMAMTPRPLFAEIARGTDASPTQPRPTSNP